MRLNGYETVFGVDLNGDGVISSEITDADNNKIVDGSEEYEYQIYNKGQSITIANKRGRTFNDSSSKHWDIIAAAATDNGFSILKAGTSKNLLGKYRLWLANSDGLITSRTKWKSGGLMRLKGYETIFGTDLNGDGVVSSEITDIDNNKIVDGSEEFEYQIYERGQGITISNKRGKTFNNSSSRGWDIVAAADSNDGFVILNAGTSRRRMEQYQLWFTNYDGRVTSRTRWKTGEYLKEKGYETIFNMDLNKDGHVGEQIDPPVPNQGKAKIRIDGVYEPGGILSVAIETDDPDGNGNLISEISSPLWENSKDNGSTWSSLGESETLILNTSHQESLIRAKVSYKDGEGFNEITTSHNAEIIKPVPVNEGQATIKIDGVYEPGGILSVAIQTDDPDGNGNLISEISSPLWENSKDNGSTWSSLGESETLILNTSHQESLIRAKVSYKDGEGFNEITTSHNAEIIKPVPVNEGQATIKIDGIHEPGGSLSVAIETNDADGNGDLESQILFPIWEISKDNGDTWSPLGVSETLTIDPEHSGAVVRAVVNYSDGDNFREKIISQVVEIKDPAPSTKDDYANGPETEGIVEVDRNIEGALEVEGDRDWFRVNLADNRFYDLSITGRSLIDPYLRLYNQNGELITENDDHHGLDSAIKYFKPTITSTYYIEVGAYGDAGTGSYIVSANEIEENSPSYNARDGYGQINIQRAFEKHLNIKLPTVEDLGENSWCLDKIYAPEVWNQYGEFMGATGAGVVVAVIDTGLDLNHQEFTGRIVQGYDFVDKDLIPEDGNGHGTHVAGTIGGANDNFGVTGVAYESNIMPIRVLDNEGYGYTSDVIAGMRYAADNGADVINLSLGGGGYSQSMFDAIEYATGLGAVVVMAAGNSGINSPDYPAAHANNYGLAVGAVNQDGNMADFSNRAGAIELDYVTAPGVDIYSSVPGNSYDLFSGTSMATPHVAGAAALLRGYDKTLTAASIEDLITGTSNNSSTSGFNSFINKFGSRTNEQSVLEHITSGTIDKLKPEQISGKLIGRVTNPAEFSTTWEIAQTNSPNNFGWERLTNNLISLNMPYSPENYSYVSNLLEQNQFDYFEVDRTWSIAI